MLRNKTQKFVLAVLYLATHLQPLLADTSSVLLDYAREAYQTGRLDDALEYANRAITKEEGQLRTPMLAQIRLMRAKIYDAKNFWNAAVKDYTYVLEFFPQFGEIHNSRGLAHFKSGRIDESITDFDKAIALHPKLDPYHWQRGISYYYAGKLDECIGQFERHRKVNPNDVENAFWHFLCKARRDGIEIARKDLLPVGTDKRTPMMEIYSVLQKKASVEDVFTAAHKTNSSKTHKSSAFFYAHLYMGLYLETLGNIRAAKFHITKAIRDLSFQSYMSDVARIHWEKLSADH